MPEGPELHLASRFINQVCNGRIFGKIAKSEISKNPLVSAPCPAFSITASSRGKEIKLTLHEYNGHPDKKYGSKSDPGRYLNVLVTFGLAGKFEFVKPVDLAKHAHLNFYTDDKEEEMVLSFVDYMRFGRWTPGADFSYTERGPCVLTDYTAFRDHVLKSLKANAFNKPICELLLNQKYFNGIGNYLRAEILYRIGIPPFVSGRSVLEPLANEPVVKSEKPDILELCHTLPQQVIALEGSWYDSKDRETLSNSFNAWLQCYYQTDMKNMADHNKRTIWYTGPAGPLAPKEQVVRGKKKGKPRQRKKKEEEAESEENEEVVSKTATKRSKTRKRKETDDKPKNKKVKTENGSKTDDKPKNKKVKTEYGSNVNKETALKTDQDTKEDLYAIQELSKDMHSTRLTRRKLKDLMGKKGEVNDNTQNNTDDTTKVTVNGQDEKSKKRGRSARSVLNNDAPYLNSAKQNSKKRKN